jgi:hypothetical protein
MVKLIFIFVAKIIGYLLILFAWFGIVAPFLVSYPSNTLVAVGFIGTIAVMFFWLYSIIRTIQKFSKQFLN